MLVVALVAAWLPSVTVHVVPTVTAIGPLTYTVTLPAIVQSDSFNSSMTGTASGTYNDSTPARGPVTFANYSSNDVVVPKGTRVSGGDQSFTTDADVTVPSPSSPGQGTTASVPVTAVSPGPNGNVGARAIDTIDDPGVAYNLCGGFLFCPRLVANRNALSGGSTKTGPQVTQKDVDALVAKIRDDLQRQLAAFLAQDPGRIYASPDQPETPSVAVPNGTVGAKDKTSFGINGTLQIARHYVSHDQLQQAVLQQLTNDATHRPPGTTVVASTVSLQAADVRAAGDRVTAQVQASADVMPLLDLDALKGRIAGLSADDAKRALADIGSVRLDFWPGWVSAVPRLPFRIDIAIDVPTGSPSPQPGASPS